MHAHWLVSKCKVSTWSRYVLRLVNRKFLRCFRLNKTKKLLIRDLRLNPCQGSFSRSFFISFCLLFLCSRSHFGRSNMLCLEILKSRASRQVAVAAHSGHVAAPGTCTKHPTPTSPDSATTNLMTLLDFGTACRHQLCITTHYKQSCVDKLT